MSAAVDDAVARAMSLLTPAQHRVLKALLRGETTAQIAARTGQSPHTVNHHTLAITRKFGVRSRAALLARFVAPPGKR